MSLLHIFNPSHDEALAAHSPYYYPAQAARMLEADLAVLPAWWANPGDCILLPEQTALPAADFTGKGLHFVHLSDADRWLPHLEGICPWGWDRLLAHRLKKGGIPEKWIPDESRLDDIRQLSSRHTAVLLLQQLRRELPHTIGTSRWCTTEEEVLEYISLYPATMLKAPWSSSGRGVFTATPAVSQQLLQRIRKLLKTQGAIEAEPMYRKRTDFAAEFYAGADRVCYRGLSVFDTSGNGAYTGNWVADDLALQQLLPETVSRQLPETVDCLCLLLTRLLKDRYEGPLGIDMMGVEDESGETVLHPCIEINLRHTMGHVALDLRPLLQPQTAGLYRLQPPAPADRDTLRLTPLAKNMEAVLLRNRSLCVPPSQPVTSRQTGCRKETDLGASAPNSDFAKILPPLTEH